MTLNGVMTVILRYFTEFGSFGTSYATLKFDMQRLREKCRRKNLV